MAKIFIVETSRTTEEGGSVIGAIILLLFIFMLYSFASSPNTSNSSNTVEQATVQQDIDYSVKKASIEDPNHRVYSSND